MTVTSCGMLIIPFDIVCRHDSLGCFEVGMKALGGIIFRNRGLPPMPPSHFPFIVAPYLR